MIHAEFHHVVEPQRSSPNGLLPVTSLVAWLIEAASAHAEERGFGYSKLRESDTTWVLARMAIEMNEYPKAYEEVTLETWVDDFNRFFSTRNFRIGSPPKPPQGGDVWKTASPLLYQLLKENSLWRRRFTTDAEGVLWERLRKKALGEKFRRQQIIGEFIVDFVSLNKKLIIEVDGGYHNDPNQQEADRLRTEILNRLGYRVIRFTNEQVGTNIDFVVQEISKHLSSGIPPLGGLGGAAYGYIKTQWSMINLTTRKACDLSEMSDIESFKVDRPCPIASPGKIASAEGECVEQYRVRYSDIDVNRHMNTVKYIEHALNLFSLSFFDEHHLKRIEVQFMAEVRFDDLLSFYKEEKEPLAYLIEIRNQHNDPVNRLKFVFEEL